MREWRQTVSVDEVFRVLRPCLDSVIRQIGEVASAISADPSLVSEQGQRLVALGRLSQSLSCEIDSLDPAA